MTCGGARCQFDILGKAKVQVLILTLALVLPSKVAIQNIIIHVNHEIWIVCRTKDEKDQRRHNMVVAVAKSSAADMVHVTSNLNVSAGLPHWEFADGYTEGRRLPCTLCGLTAWHPQQEKNFTRHLAPSTC